jgi:hypothetical protein
VASTAIKVAAIRRCRAPLYLAQLLVGVGHPGATVVGAEQGADYGRPAANLGISVLVLVEAANLDRAEAVGHLVGVHGRNHLGDRGYGVVGVAGDRDRAQLQKAFKLSVLDFSTGELVRRASILEMAALGDEGGDRLGRVTVSLDCFVSQVEVLFGDSWLANSEELGDITGHETRNESGLARPHVPGATGQNEVSERVERVARNVPVPQPGQKRQLVRVVGRGEKIRHLPRHGRLQGLFGRLGPLGEVSLRHLAHEGVLCGLLVLGQVEDVCRHGITRVGCGRVRSRVNASARGRPRRVTHDAIVP